MLKLLLYSLNVAHDTDLFICLFLQFLGLSHQSPLLALLLPHYLVDLVENIHEIFTPHFVSPADKGVLVMDSDDAVKLGLMLLEVVLGAERHQHHF
jgi:hypothetical protein